MKKHFITGLVLLLPLALTVMIIFFFANMLTRPFVGIVSAVMRQLHIFDNGFLFLSAEQAQQCISEIFILTFIFFFIVLLGIFTRWIFAHYFIRFGDFVLHRIPLVNTIYKTSQDIIKTMFASKSSAFKQVVLVPFPKAGSYTVGLVTRESIQGLHSSIQEDMVAVFVPTTPNPTSGFLMMYPRNELLLLDMTIEEAFKYIISCGVVY